MVSSDFRKEAREKLYGKWGKGACITLAYMFIIIVMDLISGVFSDNMQALLSLVITIIEVPLALGLIISLDYLMEKMLKHLIFYHQDLTILAKVGQ